MIAEIQETGADRSAVLFICSATKTPDRRLKATCERIINELSDRTHFRFLLSDSSKLQKSFKDNPKYIDERIRSWHKVLLELGLKRICLEEVDLNLMTPASESQLKDWMAIWLDSENNRKTPRSGKGNRKTFVYANRYSKVFNRIAASAKEAEASDLKADKLQEAWDDLREQIDKIYKEQRENLIAQISEVASSGKDVAENVGSTAKIGLNKVLESYDYLKMLKNLPREWMVGGAIVGGVLGVGATALAATISPAIAAATGIYLVAGNTVAGGVSPVALKYLKSKLGFKQEDSGQDLEDSDESISSEAGKMTLDDFFRSALFYVILLELQGNDIETINRELKSKLNGLKVDRIETVDEGVALLNQVRDELDQDWHQRGAQ